MNKQQALITFDPDRLADFDYQAEGQALGWIIMNALRGNQYPRERGIIEIELLDGEPPE